MSVIAVTVMSAGWAGLIDAAWFSRSLYRFTLGELCIYAHNLKAIVSKTKHKDKKYSAK